METPEQPSRCRRTGPRCRKGATARPASIASWPDGALVVYVLSRCGVNDGLGSQLDASFGTEGAVLRRCTPEQLGGFATPERRVIFSINDLDETLPAPWEWDIKRLAASFANLQVVD